MNGHKYRYTIRELLWLTAFVAVACTGIANTGQVLAVAARWSNAIGREVARIGPPLMGRDSAPREIVTPEGTAER